MPRIEPDPLSAASPADELWFANSSVTIDRGGPLLAVSDRYRAETHAASLEIGELTGLDHVACLRRASRGQAAVDPAHIIGRSLKGIAANRALNAV